jgi:ribosomal-protein-serine acetyltransferase
MGAQSPILIEVPEQLDGPRVRLRPVRAEDAHALWEAIEESRERLIPWLPWAHGDRTSEETRLFTARAQARWVLREGLEMVVLDRQSGRVLGGTGIPRLDWKVRSFEVGYWLRTSAEGHGFMREAVQLLTRMAFRNLAANRVEIYDNPRNTRSCNVALRLGFKLEGTLRNSALDGDGRPSDRHVFALIPQDYYQLEWAGAPPARGDATPPMPSV